MSSSANEYLSGEPNPDAVESRFELLSLLQQQQQQQQHRQQQSRTKIQVIDSESDHDDDEDVDVVPLPIECMNTNETNCKSLQPHAANQHLHSNEESLMEQLMKEGLKARAATAAEQNSNRKSNGQTSSSFGSLKRGFLTASRRTSSTEKNTSVVQKQERQKPALSSSSSSSSSSCIDTVPKSKHLDPSPLRLAQVQNAIHNEKSTWEKSLNAKLTSPQLLDRLSKNEIVSKRIAHPKYSAALEALQKSPKEAMEKFQNHPDVMEFIREICRELGEYFTDIGKEDSMMSRENNINDIARVEEIGSLAYDALQREKARKSQGVQSQKEDVEIISQEEQQRLDEILKDKDLTGLLMDVDLQRVIKECSDIPGKAQVYLQHELYGAKLRRLIQAGLLKFA